MSCSLGDSRAVKACCAFGQAGSHPFPYGPLSTECCRCSGGRPACLNNRKQTTRTRTVAARACSPLEMRVYGAGNKSCRGVCAEERGPRVPVTYNCLLFWDAGGHTESSACRWAWQALVAAAAGGEPVGRLPPYPEPEPQAEQLTTCGWIRPGAGRGGSNSLNLRFHLSGVPLGNGSLVLVTARGQGLSSAAMGPEPRQSRYRKDAECGHWAGE